MKFDLDFSSGEAAYPTRFLVDISVVSKKIDEPGRRNEHDLHPDVDVGEAFPRLEPHEASVGVDLEKIGPVFWVTEVIKGL